MAMPEVMIFFFVFTSFRIIIGDDDDDVQFSVVPIQGHPFWHLQKPEQSIKKKEKKSRTEEQTEKCRIAHSEMILI